MPDAKKCRHCGEWFKRQCPNCHEWINIKAKKCKYCGVWLGQDTREEQQNETSEDNEDGEYISYAWRCLKNIVWIVILLTVAWLTLPSDIEHKRILKEDVRECVKDFAREYFDNQDALTNILGNAVMNSKTLSDGVADAIIKQRFTLNVKNYKIMSLGYIRDKSTGQEAIASVAVFGIVVPFAHKIIGIIKKFN